MRLLFDDPKREHLNVKFFRGMAESIQPEDLCNQVATALIERELEVIEPLEKINEDLKLVDTKGLKLPS
jgi:hypothetical protein